MSSVTQSAVRQDEFDVERRQGTQVLVGKMLAEREEMWVQYCKIAGLEPYQIPADAARAAEDFPTEKLSRFCEVMVDYIASSHFGLYERIAEGKERRESVRHVAAVLYPRIAATTDVAVQFNDDHERGALKDDAGWLGRLSSLGEALALRIELEDKIIEKMV
jgi:regulator of sigma D